MAEDELSASVIVRHAEQDDHDDDDTGTGPVDADLVDDIQVFGAEDVDAHAYQHDGPERKDRLPCVRSPVIAPQTDGR